jgi:hypothetical protein
MFEGKFESLNFIIDHPELDRVSYEFEGTEFVIEESGCEQTLFRLDVEKGTGLATVYAAYSGDFDIMEDVTCYFDVEQLKKDVESYMERHEVGNQGEAYVKYVKLREEGYDCEDAISKCYE